MNENSPFWWKRCGNIQCLILKVAYKLMDFPFLFSHPFIFFAHLKSFSINFAPVHTKISKRCAEMVIRKIKMISRNVNGCVSSSFLPLWTLRRSFLTWKIAFTCFLHIMTRRRSDNGSLSSIDWHFIQTETHKTPTRSRKVCEIWQCWNQHTLIANFVCSVEGIRHNLYFNDFRKNWQHSTSFLGFSSSFNLQ